MGRVTFDISMSVDGYVAGPGAGREEPLGVGGMGLHDWALATKSWNEAHGRSGEGEAGTVDDEVMAETIGVAGAMLMGRHMFSGTGGPWEDPPFDGWWGDDPPFHVPVFVLTHHEREPLELGDTTFTFVTDGADRALEQARAAAGERDVSIAGSANVIQQYLRAGVVDRFQVHVAPILLGGGVPLFDSLGTTLPRLELDRAVAGELATHLRYRCAKS
jgi:dihydrofolate reductase